ncbi:hypothetical protein AM571_PC00605 (plasmid) [Rhizobium etli 8C-3]|uniref:Uncharacterized protein n=1 Tax=Rhizobium etli 8C-3 TaxID=538025 RepID=A0A1L5PDX3_RHIET|nr:hypothetical protein AM571_PC00605 [Rhizobium etli 8C-3]
MKLSYLSFLPETSKPAFAARLFGIFSLLSYARLNFADYRIDIKFVIRPALMTSTGRLVCG